MDHRGTAHDAWDGGESQAKVFRIQRGVENGRTTSPSTRPTLALWGDPARDRGKRVARLAVASSNARRTGDPRLGLRA